MKNYKFIIKGKVQGVYYRKNVEANALKANFHGYVKNLPDGTVEAAVSCEEEQYDEFMAILEKGSPKSQVDSIDVTLCDEEFSGFEIRY